MHTDRLIINTSENVIIAADHTKIGYIASSVLASLTAAKIIVTTEELIKIFVSKL